MVSPAQIVRASSFGFATGNRKPSPAVPVGDMPSTGAIHMGGGTSSVVAAANALRLNMDVRLGGIARVFDFGNRLAKLELIADLDLDAAWAEIPISK
jgi:hypothetical protein